MTHPLVCLGLKTTISFLVNGYSSTSYLSSICSHILPYLVTLVKKMMIHIHKIEVISECMQFPLTLL